MQVNLGRLRGGGEPIPRQGGGWGATFGSSVLGRQVRLRSCRVRFRSGQVRSGSGQAQGHKSGQPVLWERNRYIIYYCTYIHVIYVGR